MKTHHAPSFSSSLRPAAKGSAKPALRKPMTRERRRLTEPGFDPNLPQAHTPIVAEELRNQFNGLAAMIQQRATLDDVAVAGQMAVNQALSASSNNSNAVGQLGMYADWSYNQSQIQAILDKLDELILVLRRS